MPAVRGAAADEPPAAAEEAAAAADEDGEEGITGIVRCATGPV